MNSLYSFSVNRDGLRIYIYSQYLQTLAGSVSSQQCGNGCLADTTLQVNN